MRIEKRDMLQVLQGDEPRVLHVLADVHRGDLPGAVLHVLLDAHEAGEKGRRKEAVDFHPHDTASGRLAHTLLHRHLHLPGLEQIRVMGRELEADPGEERVRADVHERSDLVPPHEVDRPRRMLVRQLGQEGALAGAW